ncbi:hypothetical protein [Aminobacter sp. AP02]|uniref:hypothetical protein n=1 Tax=Aminobacter sp. AP02 TaxID=2135737 RepID=UPI000D6CEA7C|nr:hypothetical protein [Aminobacter sp. AP02]PWK63920.1 hypothetical protein C8K44_12287 [Aminobacter sp. AP02]
MRKHSVVVALAISATQAAYAADTVIAQPEETPLVAERPAWALQITPYMWAAGLKGNISPFRSAPTIGVEKSFSDVLNDLNFGGFVNVWGRYERFVLSGDLMYVSTTDSHAFGPLPALPGPIPPGTVVNGSVDTKQFMATLQGGYRVLETPGFTLDALGGVRFWHISNDVTVNALGLSRSYGERFGWADPVIGARALLRMTDKLSLQAQVDVGGFSVGSDFTWSALATVNYIVTDKLSLSAGYKALDADYDHGGHVYDTRLSGPVLGATWRF